MPANLAESLGIFNYADSRLDAWHQCGQLGMGDMTPQKAIEAAYMHGWNVRKVPLFGDLSEDDYMARKADLHMQRSGGALPLSVEIPRQFAIVRNEPISGRVLPIGVAGTVFEPVQNEETVGLLEALCDAYGQPFVQTIGALDGGSRTFVSMVIPREMKIAGLKGVPGENLTFYLIVINHHDGNGRLRCIVSATRPVCANTLALAESRAVSSWGIRHTGGIGGRVAEIRNTLGLSFSWIDNLESEIDQLLSHSVTVDQAKVFTKVLCEVDKAESDRGRAGRSTKAGAILKLFVESPTIVGTPSEGNAYGLFNAVAEFSDHFAPVMGSGGDSAAQAQLRARRTILQADGRATIKTKAQMMLSEMVAA
jgi:phage/plasmid-like protein (TIGR03299 family)